MTRWKEGMEAERLRTNTDRTKVMMSGKNSGHLEKLGISPCTICERVPVATRFDVRGVTNGYTSGEQV